MTAAVSLCRAALCFVATVTASIAAGPTAGNGGHQEETFDRRLIAGKSVTYFVVDTYNHRVMEWAHCAQKGKVVAGGHGKGSTLTHLSFPVDIAIDSNHHNSLVIVDRENHRVVEWPQGATKETKGTIIVGNEKGKEGSSLHDLSRPNGVTIDSHGHIIVADTGNHRILSCQRGHHDCTVVVSGDKNKKDGKKGCGDYDVHSPEDVEVDAHGHYIITDKHYDRVLACDGMSHGHIVAGGKTSNGEKCKSNCYGSKFNELYYPEGVAIDENGDYIVVDSYNNRIMKWAPNATQGERKVSKKADYGSKLSQLHLPRGVVVDQDTYVIADSMNHRILRWIPGAERGELVAGGHGFGPKENQLHLPDAVAVLHHNSMAGACTPLSTSSPMSLAFSAAVMVCIVVLASVS